jgi:two-component system response regulator FlrC
MARSASVLVVEDNDAMRDAVVELLLDVGLAAVAARDGEAALEALSHHSFEAVVSDLHMPTGDGFELLEQVRSHFPASRFILMTSEGGQRERAAAEGAFDLLMKPFDGSELLEVLHRALANSESCTIAAHAAR